MSAPDLLKALERLLDRYVGLVNSGDCGNWDPETEDEVIAARAALTTSSVDAVPVAWQFRFKSDESEWLDCSELWAHMAAARTDCETRPLYARPVPANPAAGPGLRAEDVDRIDRMLAAVEKSFDAQNDMGDLPSYFDADWVTIKKIRSLIAGSRVEKS